MKEEDTNPKLTEIIITGNQEQSSMDLTKGFRDKLRSRIRIAKDRAALSERETSQLQSSPGTSIDYCRPDSAKTFKMLVDKWSRDRSLCGRIGEEYQNEYYNFFTKEWEYEDEVTQKSSSELSEIKEYEEAQEKMEDTHDEPICADDKTRLLSDDYLKGFEDWQMYKIVPAEYISQKTRKKHEEVMYYYPSNTEVSFAEKKKDNPRYLEKEGLYIGSPPAVALKLKNKIERRILSENKNNLDWFQEDGRLKMQADPLKRKFTRIVIPDCDVHPLIKPYYKKTIKKDFDSRYIDGQTGQKRYQLDVDISKIVFTHHSLFSKEHVLAAKLIQLYHHSCKRIQTNIVKHLTDKLKTLKYSCQHLKSQEETDATKQRIQEYQQTVRQVRKQRDMESHIERLLMKNIVTTWKHLKRLREKQEYVNTSVKLLIHKKPMKKDDDEKEWRWEIDEELAEEEEEYCKWYNSSVTKYEQDVEKYKKQRKAKKSALKRKNKRMQERLQPAPEDIYTIESLNDEEYNIALKDESLLNEPDYFMPDPPPQFNRQEVLQNIQQRAFQMRRQPGESILYPELTFTATITPTDQCPLGEQFRRNEINQSKIYVKILFNNKEVCQTELRSLSPDFVVVFAEIFNIQIVQWPESIKLQIFEKRKQGNVMMAEIYAEIPNFSLTAENAQIQPHDFSSVLRVFHEHEGVGSGINFQFDSACDSPTSLFTSGQLLCSVAWGLGSDGTPLVPSYDKGTYNVLSCMKGVDALAALGASGTVDMEKLANWIKESHLDPNDPSNADLIHMIKSVTGGDGINIKDGLQVPGYFRLDHLQKEFEFCTDEDLESSPRFRMIQLREEGVPEFKNFKVIPAFDKEVAPEIFTEYELRQAEDKELYFESNTLLDSHRKAALHFFAQVRENVLRKLEICKMQKSFQDIIIEDEMSDVSTFDNIMKFLERRRPLRPKRRERKIMSVQSATIKVKLLINIVRAFNIPVRTETLIPFTTAGVTALRSDVNCPPNPLLVTWVRPFVEVMFQKNLVRTTVADGPNPSWNEELELSFQTPNNEYTCNTLQKIDDCVFINLFDEVIIDILEDERERSTNIHQRIERNWLGSIKIPFSTIYLNSRIDGTFQINAPPVLFGYTHEFRQMTDNYGSLIDFGSMSKKRTLLTMFITIEPPLLPIEFSKLKFDSNEDEKLLYHAEKWQASVELLNAKRRNKVLVVDINGNAICCTRYIRPLNPPEELLQVHNNLLETVELVAHYVSLIPFITTNLVFPVRCDIWCTSDQFLKMMCGDEEEHAVLLCNYFLFLGKKAWIVLGNGIPEGPTAYVLTEEQGEMWLWNPTTGTHSSVLDSYSSLNSVGCLINQDNIWANIQNHDLPFSMNFDTSKSSNWKPFFTSSYSNPGLHSVQPNTLIYKTTDSSYILELEDRLERVLKTKIMEWRIRFITRWNRYCTQIFRQILPRLEKHQNLPAGEDNTNELGSILATYKLSGFPLNLLFTDVNAVVDTVMATGVHLQNNNEVEFALAVHIHPYPNTVLSVWVYVASLMKKK